MAHLLRSRPLFATLSLFALGIGLASAAPPRPGGAGPAPAAGGTCDAPTAATCTAKAYILSGCASEHAAACKPHVQQAMKAAYIASKAPIAKMLRPLGTQIPADLKSGKRHAYTGPKKGKLAGSFPQIAQIADHPATPPKTTIKPMSGAPIDPRGTSAKLGSPRATTKLARTKGKGGIASMLADDIVARSGITRPPSSGTTSGLQYWAVRNPAWEMDGQAITSCEEYAYDQLYDWTRFADAAAACAGDDQCVLDVAFLPQTPGIADRELKRKDGKKLEHQYLLKKNHVLPKNALFGISMPILSFGADGPLPPDAAAKELDAVMKKGHAYHAIACTQNACKQGVERQFTNEWDFHRKMYDEHRKLSAAELAEYDRRKAEFEVLAHQWAAAAMKEVMKAKKASGKKLAHKWVDPLDTVTHDPFERMQVYRSMSAEIGQSAAKGGARTAPRAPSKVGMLPLYNPDAGPAFTLASAPAPAKKGDDAAYSVCNPMKGHWGLEMAGAGPLSCRLSVFLQQEYARKKSGQKSCLDLDNHDCDWSPAMFEARFVEGVPYLADQHDYEVECVDYTNDVFTKPVANLVAAEAYIAEMKAVIAKAMQTLQPYMNAAKNGFGRSWQAGDSFGDKDWLAAGYSYDAGWDVVAHKQSGKGVCSLEGGMHGGFKANATLIGKTLNVADVMADLDVNRGGNAKGSFHAHLHLLGVELADVDESVSAVFTQPLVNGSVQIPSGYKPSFNFMAGPIPITGAVWGELGYGADLTVEAKAVASPSCDLSEIGFGAGVGLEPRVALDAKAQVGVGVSGLVSAGIRGAVNLVTIAIPIDSSLLAKLKSIKDQEQMSLEFQLDPKIELSTLSGYLALYLEFLLYEEEWELFRWNGVSTSFNLLGDPLVASLPLLVLDK